MVGEGGHTRRTCISVAFWGGVVENARVVGSWERNEEGVDTGRRSAGASRFRRNVVAMVVVGCCWPARQLNWGRRRRDARMETQLFGSRVAARDLNKRRQLSALAEARRPGHMAPVARSLQAALPRWSVIVAAPPAHGALEPRERCLGLSTRPHPWLRIPWAVLFLVAHVDSSPSSQFLLFLFRIPFRRPPDSPPK